MPTTSRFIVILCFILSIIGVEAQPSFQFHYLKFAATGLDSRASAEFADLNGDGQLDVIAGFEGHRELLMFQNQDNTFQIQVMEDSLLGYDHFQRTDINKDGYFDLIVSYKDLSAFWRLALYVNDGNNEFAYVGLATSGSDNVENVQVIDMDGDGDLDIVADVEGGNDNAFTYLENDGKLNFTSHLVLLDGAAAQLYGVADMDADGLQDLVATVYSYKAKAFVLMVLEHDLNVNGLFISHPIDTFDDFSSCVVGDFVGSKGVTDIMVGPETYKETQAYVYENKGNFSFAIFGQPTVKGYTQLLQPVEYNGDALMDLFYFDKEGSGVMINQGSGKFKSQPLYEIQFMDVRWEDFNQDGLNDLLVTNGGGIDLLLQNANGEYNLFWSNKTMGSDHLLIEDFDRNGEPDLITTENEEFVFMPQSFDEKWLPAPLQTPKGMSVDFKDLEALVPYDREGDGDIDFLTNHNGSLYWLENDGLALTAHKANLVDPVRGIIRSGDLDKDGKPDFVYQSPRLTWIEWNGSGFNTVDLGVVTDQFDLMDVDGDNDLDVVYIGYNINTGHAELRYADNANGIFSNKVISDISATVSSNVTSGESQLELKDIDGDGDQDIFLLVYKDNMVAWFRNDGNLSFTGQVIANTISQPRDIEFADFDLDGYQDFVVSSGNTGKVILFENSGSSAYTSYELTNKAGIPGKLAVGDIDQDGDMDIFSTSVYDRKLIWLENGKVDCQRTYHVKEEKLCQGDSLLVNGVYVKDDGIFTDTLTSGSGCDSIVVDQVDFLPVPTVSVKGTDATLSLSQDVDSVQWYKDGSILTNENGLTLNAGLYGKGEYYAFVSITNCQTSTDSFAFVPVRLDRGEANTIRLYPNPTSGQVVIELPLAAHSYAEIQLMTLTGQVLRTELGTASFHVLDLSSYPSGVYLVRYTSPTAIAIGRVEKE